ETAKQTAGKYFKQSSDVLDISLQWISFDDLDISEETYTLLTDKVKKYGLSDNPPTYEEFVKNDF
ncbi:MAG: metal ABC transporter substrate-binding protein, partial [Oscillospiraceae bacterium]|nr:metal ABC transporter substrate-binding protein [Oscillospiraceae bacterium]